jgi:hypothetical protein
MVLDAFSSDSIPVHLLTLDALREYSGNLSSRGVIAVHVSNRFFDLGPTVAAAAEAMGWRWANLLGRLKVVAERFHTRFEEPR